MNLQQIKEALEYGLPVFWKNEGYRVHKDELGQYLITFTSNNYTIGLTHQDGVTMNGEEQDFFVDPAALSGAVDNVMTEYPVEASKEEKNVRYVGFHAGFERLWVAVWYYLPDTEMPVDEACEIAIDLLLQRGWFADPANLPEYVVI